MPLPLARVRAHCCCCLLPPASCRAPCRSSWLPCVPAARCWLARRVPEAGTAQACMGHATAMRQHRVDVCGAPLSGRAPSCQGRVTLVHNLVGTGCIGFWLHAVVLCESDKSPEGATALFGVFLPALVGWGWPLYTPALQPEKLVLRVRISLIDTMLACWWC